MFYVKAEIAEGVTIQAEVTHENVYNRCPKCGAETPVDLADIATDGELDLYGTAVYCKECSEKAWLGAGRGTPMVRVVDVPLTDPRISPQMRAYLFKKGFRLKEYNGLLMVLGEKGGESVELGYELFCAVTRRYYADEFAEVCEGREIQ